MTNDEVYYWDWSRELHWSYIDHPPGVAWMGFIGNWLGNPRAGVALFSVLAFYFVVWIQAALRGTLLNRDLIWAFGFFMFAPYLLSLGVFLLPDAGLMIALYAALFVLIELVRQNQSSAKSKLLAAVLGVLLGLAGCFKLHAVVLWPWFWLAIILSRNNKTHFLNALSCINLFTIVVTATAIGFFPVLLWNSQNSWASFVFQSTHGLTKLELNPVLSFRFIAGTVLLASVRYVWLMRESIVNLVRINFASNPSFLLPFVGGFFSFAALLVLSAFKPLMVHWALPFLFLLLPFVVVYSNQTIRNLKYEFSIYAVLLYFVVPVLSLPGTQQLLLETNQNKAGSMFEVTLWQPLAKEISKFQAEENLALVDVVCAPRWFWVAQLAYHLPTQPRVCSLDRNRLSYYHYRDDPKELAGKTVLLVGEKNSVIEIQAQGILRVVKIRPIEVPNHEDIEILAINAVFLDDAAKIKEFFAGMSAKY